MIHVTEPKQPSYFAFTYDGTQDSLDELAEQWDGAASHPLLGDSDETTFQVTNSPSLGWKTGDLDTVCVFRVDTNGEIRLQDDYPNQAAYEQEWTEPA